MKNDKRLVTMVSEELKKELERHAKEVGMSSSSYVRMLILDKFK